MHLMRGETDMSEIELDSNKDNRDATAARVTVMDLFRPRVILFRTLNMCYQVRENKNTEERFRLLLSYEECL